MEKKENIKYGEYEECLLDLYLPEADSFPVFLWFHGGGFTAGDKVSATYFADYLTKRGCAVVSANYRMYPNAKFPDFIRDGAKAVAWVKENISKYGNCEELYVGGTSAGGYLSMLLCFDKKYYDEVGINPGDISGYIHDAGQPTSHFNVLNERGIDTKRVIVDETAPLYHVGIQKEYPRMFFIVSDDDMPNRYEQTMLMLSSLKQFGIDAENKIMHGKHCAYISAYDENKNSIFGKLIYDFISDK